MNSIQQTDIVTHYLQGDGIIPNSALPLLVYPGVMGLPENDPARVFEILFAQNQWPDSWRNGIYAFHHYHSTAHEVLGIACGHADVLMGGSKGVTFTVRAGDVMVIPAGVGHKNLGASPDLLVVGAYPKGQRVNLCRENTREYHKALEQIPRVVLPAADPVYGPQGPLMILWQK